jgi:hypothetical protein
MTSSCWYLIRTLYLSLYSSMGQQQSQVDSSATSLARGTLIRRSRPSHVHPRRFTLTSASRRRVSNNSQTAVAETAAETVCQRYGVAISLRTSLTPDPSQSLANNVQVESETDPSSTFISSAAAPSTSLSRPPSVNLNSRGTQRTSHPCCDALYRHPDSMYCFTGIDASVAGPAQPVTSTDHGTRQFSLSTTSPTDTATEQFLQDRMLALNIHQMMKDEAKKLVQEQEAQDHALALAMQEGAEDVHDHAVALNIYEEEAEANRKHAAKVQPRFRECTVCCESLHPLIFPANPPSLNCTHKSEVCPPCLEQWVSTKIDSNARSRIDCPQCTTLLTHNDVRRACSPETFAKYDKFALLTVVDKLENFHWCLRAGCSGGQEQYGGLPGYMKCHECDYEQCLQHKTPWHVGESCREYDQRLGDQVEKQQRDREDLQSSGFIDAQIQAAVWKRCPTCRTPIEKSGGCAQVVCKFFFSPPSTCYSFVAPGPSKMLTIMFAFFLGKRDGCGQKFCWDCLAKWEDMLVLKNMAHLVSCRYRTGPYPYRYRE